MNHTFKKSLARWMYPRSIFIAGFGAIGMLLPMAALTGVHDRGTGAIGLPESAAAQSARIQMNTAVKSALAAPQNKALFTAASDAVLASDNLTPEQFKTYAQLLTAQGRRVQAAGDAPVLWHGPYAPGYLRDCRVSFNPLGMPMTAGMRQDISACMDDKTDRDVLGILSVMAGMLTLAAGASFLPRAGKNWLEKLEAEETLQPSPPAPAALPPATPTDMRIRQTAKITSVSFKTGGKS